MHGALGGAFLQWLVRSATGVFGGWAVLNWADPLIGLKYRPRMSAPAVVVPGSSTTRTVSEVGSVAEVPSVTSTSRTFDRVKKSPLIAAPVGSVAGFRMVSLAQTT